MSTGKHWPYHTNITQTVTNQKAKVTLTFEIKHNLYNLERDERYLCGMQQCLGKKRMRADFIKIKTFSKDTVEAS